MTFRIQYVFINIAVPWRKFLVKCSMAFHIKKQVVVVWAVDALVASILLRSLHLNISWFWRDIWRETQHVSMIDDSWSRLKDSYCCFQSSKDYIRYAWFYCIRLLVGYVTYFIHVPIHLRDFKIRLIYVRIWLN